MIDAVKLLVVAVLLLLASNGLLWLRVLRNEKVFDRIGTVAARGVHRG